MRLRPALATLAVLALASPLLPSATAAPAAADPGVGSPSLTSVRTLAFEKATGSTGPNRGTDIEFAEIGGVEYALAGTYQNGLQIVDISTPEDAEIVSVFDCGVVQGDVQVFEKDGRTYAGFTQDVGTAVFGSACFAQLRELGFGSAFGARGMGTVIADITDVENPTAVSFVPFPKGSHNHTIHPSGDYIYNSNSELITNVAANEIEIYDISDLAKPEPVPALDLPPVPTSLGADSHDITFNEDGTRAYSAALSQTVIIDTTNPRAPKIISTIVDPTINVVHQADPVTLTDPLLGTRDFVVIEDEFAGAAGTGQCPNGGVHVYDVTGAREAAPVKVGYWNISDVRPTSTNTTSTIGTSSLGRCTAHVFDLHEDAAIMTIAYYNGGVRVVDLSGLVGVALGGTGVGMKEIGSRRFDNSDTWAVKTPKINVDRSEKSKNAGDFFLYGNDQRRGLDVYRFDASEVTPGGTGEDVWMGAAEAAKALASRSRLDLSGYEMYCLPGKVAGEADAATAALTQAHHG